MDGGDRTFRVNFTTEGVARLRERIEDKLKEYMGDYTDDTLVEYVIVLLKNGRRKDEAKSELDVFLGDDSESFVSWLWDHLGTSISLYVQQSDLHLDEATKTTPASEAETEPQKIESVSERGTRASEKQKKQERKGLVKDGNENEKPIPESSVAEHADVQDEPHKRGGRMKRSFSPHGATEKKRRRHDERRPVKSEISQTAVTAPRRLLQFAVRDAVATSRPTNTTSEPSQKRLRSVVSTPTADSHEERSQRIRSEAGLHTAMSVAIKAVAEAVKDVSKVKPSRSVFDRLGHDDGVPKTVNHIKGQGDVEDGEGEDVNGEEEDIHLSYQRHNGASHELNTDMHSEMRYGEGYGFDIIGQKKTHAYQLTSSGVDWVDSRTSRNVPKPQHQVVRKVPEFDSHNAIADGGAVVVKSHTSLMKEKTDLKESFTRNVKPNMGQQQEPQKIESTTGLYSTAAPPTEDADSRTIFISNVHFAATKDTISRHFNKFGDVLKVIILTDPSTGQPKGFAYVEFLRKEAAEQALSLDGTSFMSRILKIVRKSSAQPEPTSAVVWPRVARAPPFAVPRLGRPPFGRGFPTPYRSRVLTKPGPRSFQWKRDTHLNEAAGHTSNNAALPPPTRSLTYVRSDPKTGEAKTNEQTSGAA